MHFIAVCSQLSPFYATGDMAKIVSQLAQAQREQGAKVTLISAHRPEISVERYGLARRLSRVPVEIGGQRELLGVLEGKLPAIDVDVVLVDPPQQFDSAPPNGDPTSAVRSSYLLAVATVALAETFGWHPHAVHAHGWQAGLVPLLLRQRRPENFAQANVIFSIYEPAQLGLFSPALLDELEIGRELFDPDGIEFDGQASLLKAGIVGADQIVAPSPTFAAELKTAEFGCGLEGMYQSLGQRLTGVLGGVNPASFNPLNDYRLAARFDASDFSPKAHCKEALQQELGLPVDRLQPLLLCLGKLSEARGIGLVLDSADTWSEQPLQMAFVGDASPAIDERLGLLASSHDNVAYRAGEISDDLHRRLLAGADALLLPSKREQGSLLPLEAMRYGCVPVVRTIGTLDDCVVEYDPRSGTGTGFRFNAFETDEFVGAIRRLLAAYAKPSTWHDLVKGVMSQDHSWTTVARRFETLYTRDPIER